MPGRHSTKTTPSLRFGCSLPEIAFLIQQPQRLPAQQQLGWLDAKGPGDVFLQVALFVESQNAPFCGPKEIRITEPASQQGP